MSDHTINEKGEILVTTTDVSTLESTTFSTDETLLLILQELRKITIHLSILSGEEINDSDIGGLK